ncbi:MAG: DUF58 domain-containing protein [Treponema sp.]|nr:DUF58 domain-containing protein [Treponema sp.]
MMNNENLSKKAKLLEIDSIALSEHMRSGNFRSIYTGQGIEFSDVREYLPGDNVRSIDWNVSARMGRTFVKQYEEDRELNVFFVLDCSLSMTAKLPVLTEAATLLLLASRRNSASIGAVFFDGEIQYSFPPKNSVETSSVILSKIARLQDGGIVFKRGSALSSALRGAANLLKKRSLVFVISDFRAAQWKKELAFLAQKNDVVAIRIVDDFDSELPDVGFLHFSDSESGEIEKIPTFSKSFRRFWFERNRAGMDGWKSFCFKHGAFPLPMNTKDDILLVLSRFFEQRKR